MKKFQNQFYYLQLLKASTNMGRQPSSEKDYASQFDSDDAVHAIYLEKDDYVDDLETITSGFDGSECQSNDYSFLEASFVQDI